MKKVNELKLSVIVDNDGDKVLVVSDENCKLLYASEFNDINFKMMVSKTETKINAPVVAEKPKVSPQLMYQSYVNKFVQDVVIKFKLRKLVITALERAFMDYLKRRGLDALMIQTGHDNFVQCLTRAMNKQTKYKYSHSPLTKKDYRRVAELKEPYSKSLVNVYKNNIGHDLRCFIMTLDEFKTAQNA